jgi:putative spermidine/putrescine transport system substrate-binding protein
VKRERASRLILALVAAAAMAGCGRKAGSGAAPPSAADVAKLPWAQIEQRARGRTVQMTMWQGDPFINAYMRDYVAPALESQDGITLSLGGGQGDSLVSQLMTEREAGRNVGAVDLVWINGETFYQLRQIDALFGPFTGRLPNNGLVAWSDPTIRFDFQKEVDGFEAPWGNVQFVLIYDTARVGDPPRTLAALEAWVRAHPGRFTIDNSFTGMTFLKCLLYALAGDPKELAGPFDEAKYRKYSGQLWEYFGRLKPYLWKQGRTYPEGVAQLHQLFANGVVDFTMSNNDGEVDNKVALGTFPPTARAYVLDTGTIRNSHYLGIPRTAPNPAGALVVCNFLESAAAQCQKLRPDTWADGTVLDVGKLSPDW